MLNSNDTGGHPLKARAARQDSAGQVVPYAPLNNEYGQPIDDSEGGIDVLALLLYVLKYRWFIALMIALGLIGSVAVTWMETPRYKTSAKLEIGSPSAKVFEDFRVTSNYSELRSYYTAIQKLKSQSVAQRVVFELKLADNADFLFPTPNFSPKNLLTKAFGFKAKKSLDDLPPETREQIAIGRLRANLEVNLVPNTSLIQITFSNQIPKLAREIADGVAASFIDQSVDETTETSDLARQFIEEQVGQTKQKLQASEQALVNYAKSEGITVTGSEISLIASNIGEINSALSNAMQERLDYSRLVKQIEAGRGASLPEVLDSTGIQSLKQQVAELRANYEQKRTYLKPEFPEMKALSREMAGLEKEIQQAVEVVSDSIVLKRDEAIAKEADLRAKLKDLEQQQSAFQDKNIQYTILKREVESNRSQYESLIGKLNEVGVGSALKGGTASLVDRAALPGSPYTPKFPINLAIALAISIAAAAAAIYLFELLDNTFSNPDQLEAELKLPVLGILPMIEKADMPEQMSDHKSSLSEAYRSLRTSLQFSSTDGIPKSLLVSSSEPSEGKSTTSYKLAQDFGVLGLRVLVLDADLRKPNLHLQFETDNTIGLSNLLTNTARREDLQTIFRPTRFANVTFLSAGTIPPNPPDLLSSPKMAMLLEATTKQFDIVIIDSPPVMGLSDAPILARLTEGVLLVVSANQVSRKSAQLAVKRLKAVGAQIFGTAFSKFSAKSFEYAYTYRYMTEGYYTLPNNSADSAEGVQVSSNVDSGNSVKKVRDGLRRASNAMRDRLNGA